MSGSLCTVSALEIVNSSRIHPAHANPICIISCDVTTSKKLPLHLVVLLHEGAVVVVVVVVVVMVMAGQSNYARQMRVGSRNQEGLKKVVKKSA